VENNIKINLREKVWGVMYWIDLAQDKRQRRALLNMVMNFRVLQHVGKFLNSCATDGFINLDLLILCSL
jgi:hypothetical protein